ncbi:MAG: ribonuclease HII [Candidatus Altiarchaeales archaeon HGW-Altiarchaeales-3]|nr:MAG: ribonuclease HII [Candidatus Altiarchaeales archaeon HGW-Altiarchaeales-3]
MKNLICGIDEAGRGPVFGPLILAAAVFDSPGREELRKLKVKDSKRIAKKRRDKLEPEIKEIACEWHTIAITPYDIDLIRKNYSLNVIEAMYAAKLILKLKTNPAKIIIDAADAVPERYKNNIINFVKEKNENFSTPVISEHKADDNYIDVSAASILAKVERDRIIEKLKDKYGEIGSGYPSDSKTKNFLKKLMANSGELPDFVRKSWNTVKNNKNKISQAKLMEF